MPQNKAETITREGLRKGLWHVALTPYTRKGKNSHAPGLRVTRASFLANRKITDTSAHAKRSRFYSLSHHWCTRERRERERERESKAERERERDRER